MQYPSMATAYVSDFRCSDCVRDIHHSLSRIMQYHFFFDLAAFLLFFGSAAASVSEGCGSGVGSGVGWAM